MPKQAGYSRSTHLLLLSACLARNIDLEAYILEDCSGRGKTTLNEGPTTAGFKMNYSSTIVVVVLVIVTVTVQAIVIVVVIVVVTVLVTTMITLFIPILSPKP